MNKLYSFTSRMLIVSAFLIILSCGKDDPQPTAAEIQLEKLSATWKISSVKRDDVAVTDWNAFTLTIGKGSYSTTHSFNALVWPTTGTWEFVGEDVNKILRDKDVTMDAITSDTMLQLTFTVSGSAAGRTEAINGKYIFTLIKQ